MKSRLTKTEKLDDLSLSGQALHGALQSLAWINRWMGNHQAVINAVHAVGKNQNSPIRIIDLGCGGGDLIAAVAKSLQLRKIQFTITGIDGNANSLDYAKKNCADFGDIYFLQADILDKEFRIPPCDILLSSHFMYHFPEDQLVDFLRNNLSAVSTAVIFSELARSRIAASLFRCSSFLLPISNLAKEDGQLAIKRSFTREEWTAILHQADVSRFRLQSVPLFRILLTILTGNI